MAERTPILERVGLWVGVISGVVSICGITLKEALDVSLPTWAIWCSLIMLTFCVGFWLGWRYERVRGKAMPESSGLPRPPAYTTDVINDIRWRWRWELDPNSLWTAKDLRAFCRLPDCDKELHPRYDPEDPGRASLGCDRKECPNFVEIDVDYHNFKTSIGREIERRQRLREMGESTDVAAIA